MIVTVTPNAALDGTYRIPAPDRPWQGRLREAVALSAVVEEA